MPLKQRIAIQGNSPLPPCTSDRSRPAGSQPGCQWAPKTGPVTLDRVLPNGKRDPAYIWPPAIPIYYAMPYHDTNFGFPDYGRGRWCDRWVLTIVAVSLVVASGCGSGVNALLPQTSVEIIRGKDSAGATIELEKRGDNLTQARVIDVVLGTGDAEIISTADGVLEFTIEFPAGATISYVGAIQDNGDSSALAISGTWTQHSAGIFGEDAGTWHAPTNPEQQTRR